MLGDDRRCGTAGPYRAIDQLDCGVGHAGFAFQRNGRWHDAVQAQGHLREKYAWLRKRGLLDSA